jgi:hypothetical protein
MASWSDEAVGSAPVCVQVARGVSWVSEMGDGVKFGRAALRVIHLVWTVVSRIQ